MPKETVVLAYSGGLDTSCILKWLLEKNYDVVCYMANIGQEEDFAASREKAMRIGAKEVVIDDVRRSFIEDYVWTAVRLGLLYESRYLLGTSLARPCISVGMIKCARERGAKYISHGATGKGNDQVRFELSCYYLWPEVKVIAPWRMTEFCAQFQGRQDLLKYAAKNNIPVPVTPKEPWSIDANLMHVSYESGILENPETEPPENLFTMTVDPKKVLLPPLKIEIGFDKGSPSFVKGQGQIISDSLEMFSFLNKLAGAYGIGRIDIVENRYIGLKSRGVYETPAGAILHAAHTDLEVFCLDKEVYRIKQSLRDKLSDFVYNGYWFSPEGSYTMRCIDMAEENVTGIVKIELSAGTVTILGRASEFSTYNEALVSMDAHADFSPEDTTGFINIQAIRLKEYRRMQNNK